MYPKETQKSCPREQDRDIHSGTYSNSVNLEMDEYRNGYMHFGIFIQENAK